MTQEISELRLIPLSKIRPWAGNPRKSFPEASLAALAESIKSQGVLQPLLLRPCPAGRGRSKTERAIETNLGMEAPSGYEIADGERRYHAAKLAGQKVVPALVRELDERQMYEISLVSEGQREDLSALERADGLQKLVDYFDGRVDDAAAKLGKSPSAVRAALRLRQLPAAARKAVTAGTLSLSVAELIAARPSPAMREKVAAYALTEQGSWLRGSHIQELPSYRVVKDWVRQECMIELKQAPFPPGWKSPGGADACTPCPHRSGNNREEFPDGRADLCTNPECFRAKAQAWHAGQTAAAKAAGHMVLDAVEGAKLFPYDKQIQHGAPWFDLRDQCYEDRKNDGKPRSYKQLLEPHLQPADVVLCPDKTGELHRLVSKDVALPILRKEHGLYKDQCGGSAGRTSAELGAEAAQRRAENELSRRTDLLLLEAAAAKAEAWAKEVKAWPAGLVGLWGAALAELLGRVWAERQDLLLKRRGLKPGARQSRAEVLLQAGRALQPAELVGLVAEVLVALEGLSGWESGRKKELATLFGLDHAAAKKEAAAAMRDKKKAKTINATKGKKTAKGRRPAATAAAH